MQHSADTGTLFLLVAFDHLSVVTCILSNVIFVIAKLSLLGLCSTGVRSVTAFFNNRFALYLISSQTADISK